MKKKQGIGLTGIIQSVLSAAFGVQKKSTLERDVEKGKPVYFIIAGILGTLIFIAILMVLVTFITRTVNS